MLVSLSNRDITLARVKGVQRAILLWMLFVGVFTAVVAIDTLIGDTTGDTRLLAMVAGFAFVAGGPVGRAGILLRTERHALVLLTLPLLLVGALFVVAFLNPDAPGPVALSLFGLAIATSLVRVRLLWRALAAKARELRVLTT